MGYTRVIQVANLSPSVTKDHMRNLFYPLGRISDMKLFPERDNPVIPVATKILYIKFESSETVGVALHLNNMVFLDRMIDVRPFESGKIPDETVALQAANSLMMQQQTTLSHLAMREDEVMKTIINPNQRKREEKIAKTIIASNLPNDVNNEKILNFFSQAGDVDCIKLAEGFDENNTLVNGVFVEYCSLPSVQVALTLNNAFFEKQHIIVQKSSVAIQEDIDSQKKEYEDSLKRVTEAQIIIAKAAGTGVESAGTPGTMGKKLLKSRSRTPIRSLSPGHNSRIRRSFSPPQRPPKRTSHSKRSRSRSRSKRRHRSKSRTRRRRRSRSRNRKSSHSKKSPNKERIKEKKEQLIQEINKDSSKLEDSSEDEDAKKKELQCTKSISEEEIVEKREVKTSKRRSRSRSRRRRHHRSRSRSRRRRSRSRHRRRRSRSKRRSKSPRRKSRRSRSKSKHRDRKKRRSRSTEVKVKRDYDEEEKCIVESEKKENDSNLESN